jgi:hypothetical protein
VPDPQSAEALVGALPLLEVGWELVSDQDSRALLAALNFEASTTRVATCKDSEGNEFGRQNDPGAPHA